MPDHLKQLAKDVSSYSTHLFDDEIKKRISKLAATKQHYKNHQPKTVAVKGNVANNQMDTKVGLLETRQ